MTALVCTLTPAGAWLSLDSLFVGPALAAAERAKFSQAAAQYGRETIPELRFGDNGAVTVRKVMTIARARMAIGTTGNLGSAACLGVAALEHEAVDDFALALPAHWQSIPPAARDARATVIVVGWSNKAGRVIGYSGRADQGMQAQPLHDGTCWTPDPDMHGANSDDIRRLIDDASEGRDVEALHLAAGRNIAAASLRDRYGGVIIGGILTTAVVRQDGVLLRDGPDLAA